MAWLRINVRKVLSWEMVLSIHAIGAIGAAIGAIEAFPGVWSVANAAVAGLNGGFAIHIMIVAMPMRRYAAEADRINRALLQTICLHQFCTERPDDPAPPLSPIDGLPVIRGDYYDGERD